MSENLSTLTENFFIGGYSHTIDEKKRIRIPAPFRKAVGNTFTLTAGGNGRIVVLPNEEVAVQLKETHEAMRLKSMYLSEKQKKSAMMLRTLSFVVTEDTQGRFVIPSNLLRYAKIKTNVITVGMGERIEIWCEDRYWQYLEDLDVEEEISNSSSKNTNSCNCPDSCKCGCKDGKECTCGC